MAADTVFHIYRNLGDYLSWSITPSSLFNTKNKASLLPHRSCWEDLPDGIVENIFQRLSTFNRIRMSAVSKSCLRQMKDIRPAPQLPWLLMNDWKFFDLYDGRVGDLKVDKRFKQGWFIGSSRGWLIFAQKSFTYLPWNHIYKAKQYMKENWPSFYSYSSHIISKIKEPTVEAEFFLLNPISKALHQLPCLTAIPVYKHQRHHYLCQCNRECSFKQIAISSSDISQLIVAAVINPDNTEDSIPRLVVCRPGRDKQWTIFSDNGDQVNIGNIYFYRGTLLVLCCCRQGHVNKDYTVVLGEGEAVRIKIVCIGRAASSTLKIPNRVSTAMEEGQEALYIGVPYAVESTQGELLSVIKTTGVFMIKSSVFEFFRTCSFNVFKIDPDTGDSQKMHDIGDQVIFLGGSSCQTFSARDLQLEGIRGNCIYFVEDYLKCRESGIYYLDDGKFERSLPVADFPSGMFLAWFMPNL
ncbi:hypothetical protein HS088_TW17G00191 [Tripterygium wilfordii]|uniref:F-box protein n=1 Tax=Tripterygium wilfordii TaxID=458696 RepID=A0A7J7CES7_TRIWF|nr:uncharacterized protein LOC119982656 [Tripterygium wilfordii]KAF5732661.1 hypothetical protein HS088_TW17G00191 [Tripterygium wilfordii]